MRGGGSLHRQFGPRAGLLPALGAVLLAAGCAGVASRSPGTAEPSAWGSVPTTATPQGLTPTPRDEPTATLDTSPTPPETTPAAPPSEPAITATDPADPWPIPAEPPVVVLHGLSGGSASGVLGSYTWGSVGSDASWIVGKVVGKSPAGASLETSVGDGAVVSWSAKWAPVAGGVAGSPAGGGSGTGGIAVRAPATPGDWSLAVTVTFGPGHNAVYFWHLDITG